MNNHLTPEATAWYQDLINGNLFEVVAVDEGGDTIEY
jgi:hypothetical protein